LVICFFIFGAKTIFGRLASKFEKSINMI
jgi:hypothetical protein